MVQGWRLFTLILMLSGWGLALAVRTVYVQVVEHQRYRLLADEEHWGKQEIMPQRGAIRDVRGHPLAMTVVAYNISIDPSVELSPEEVKTAAETLAPLLSLPAARITALYQQQESKQILIKAGVPYDLGIKIASLRLPGLRFAKEVRRVYPEGSLAAQLLGFVGRDQQGLTGIEADFNADLHGRPGVIVYERDTGGQEIPLGLREMEPPEEGADLVLTLDRVVQRLAERELEAALQRHRAVAGTIIVMEPASGAILGLASRPSFDLQTLDLQDDSQMALYRNPVVTDMYEPGSTFKVITMASALNEKKVAPGTTMDDTGVVVKNGWPIRNWDYRANGVQTMTEVLIRSANVGAVWVSDQLGPDLFYQYLHNFGFGEPTNVGLGGEAPGQVRWPQDPGWSPIDLATNSFGQGISVTPLQMVTAVSAVINGGKLMRPYVIQQMVGPRGTRTFEPVAVRRVISDEASGQIRAMLQAVVEQGTKVAAVPGYRVGVKTGTAQRPTPTGYSDETIASVVGFAPVDNPRFVILVRIDSPQDSPWGGTVAAPIFASLAKQLLVYMKVPPEAQLVAQQ